MIIVRFMSIVLLAALAVLLARLLWLDAAQIAAAPVSMVVEYAIVGACMMLYWLVRWLIRRSHSGKQNLNWFETFSHELTHTVVSLLTFREVYSFNAGKQTGKISSSGGEFTLFLTSMAPYCLPIYTYFFLLFRPIIRDEFMWLIDVLIGASVGFHVVCFATQTRSYQTDINRYPLALSYTYIIAMLLFNTCVLIDALRPGSNVFYAFYHVLRDMIPLTL